MAMRMLGRTLVIPQAHKVWRRAYAHVAHVPVLEPMEEATLIAYIRKLQEEKFDLQARKKLAEETLIEKGYPRHEARAMIEGTDARLHTVDPKHADEILALTQDISYFTGMIGGLGLIGAWLFTLFAPFWAERVKEESAKLHSKR